MFCISMMISVLLLSFLLLLSLLLQVYPMTGSLSTFLTKPKQLRGMCDAIFVSSRTAQVLSETSFPSLCRDSHTVIAVETAKFLVPLRQDTQNALATKEEELATQNNLKRIAGKSYSMCLSHLLILFSFIINIYIT